MAEIQRKSRHKAVAEPRRGTSPRRRRVLLAMGIPSHQRQAGIIRYAREAGRSVDARLLSFHAVGQDQAYLDSTHYDGALALLSVAEPWLVPLVRRLRVPVVDMWAHYPNEP